MINSQLCTDAQNNYQRDILLVLRVIDISVTLLGNADLMWGRLFRTRSTGSVHGWKNTDCFDDNKTLKVKLVGKMGEPNLQDWKIQHWQMTDEVARIENDGQVDHGL